MKIYKTPKGAIISDQGKNYIKNVENWDTFLNRENLFQALQNDIKALAISKDQIISDNLEAPMGSQEIWASGVT